MIMNVVKYDHFVNYGLQDEMTRLFAGQVPGNREAFTSGSWAPSVDIYEDKDRLVLEAELPGMNQEDFEISVENNVLTLKGERKFEKKPTATTIIVSNVLTDRLLVRSLCRRP